MQSYNSLVSVLVVYTFLVLKVPIIIFSGLGYISAPPLTIMMYIFSIVTISFWFFKVMAMRGYTLSIDILLLFKVIYILVTFIVISVYFMTVIDSNEYLTFYLGFLLSFCSYLVLGFYLYNCYTSSSFSVLLIAWLLPVSTVLIIGDIFSLTINYRLLFGEFGYDYLLVGDLIVLLSFVLLLKIPSENRLLIGVIVLITIITLFKNGSRTSFYVFVFSFIFSGLYIYKIRSISFAVFTGAILLLITFSMNLQQFDFTDSRILLVFQGDSSSLGVRQKIQDIGMSRIIDNLFIGDLLGQLNYPLAVSPIGSYIHNILSHFAQFGGVVFVLYIVSWLGLMGKAYVVVKKSNEKYKSFILIAMLIYAFTCLIFSRAFVHTLFELFWCFIFLVLSGNSLIINRVKE